MRSTWNRSLPRRSQCRSTWYATTCSWTSNLSNPSASTRSSTNCSYPSFAQTRGTVGAAENLANHLKINQFQSSRKGPDISDSANPTTQRLQSTGSPYVRGDPVPVVSAWAVEDVGVMSRGRSSSLPLWNNAPARTGATEFHAFAGLCEPAALFAGHARPVVARGASLLRQGTPGSRLHV